MATGVNTPICDEDSIELKELMVFIVPICVLREMELELLLVVVTESIIRRDLHLDDADGVECLSNAEIFEELARMRYEKLPPKLTFYKAFFSTQWKFLIHIIVQCLSAKGLHRMSLTVSWHLLPRNFLMYPHFLQVVLDHQVDDMTTHNTRYKSPALTLKFNHNNKLKKVWKYILLMPNHPQLVLLHQLTFRILPPTPHDTPLPYQPPTPPASPLQDPPTLSYDSPMPLLTTLMETCATLSQKVIELEKDKHSLALEILQLKKRVKRLERKNKSKTLGLKRLRKVGAVQRVESSTDTILGAKEDASKHGGRGGELQPLMLMRGRTNLNVVSKGVSAISAPKLVSTVEPIVFDDEDVTMIMAQTLIKIKVKKARILDEKIAQKLHDEEVQKDAARNEQERVDMEKALEL
nr:hypothetical protein [Tanacetum cinerariifolium]